MSLAHASDMGGNAAQSAAFPVARPGVGYADSGAFWRIRKLRGTDAKGVSAPESAASRRRTISRSDLLNYSISATYEAGLSPSAFA